MISYDRVVFFTTKKLFCKTWSSANFIITDVIFYAFPSSFLHSVEKMSQFLIFLSISSYLWYFLIHLVFLNLICMCGFLVSPGVFMETWGLCNLRKWRKFEILICKIVKKNLKLVKSQVFIMIGWKLLYRPECFIMRVFFLLLEKLILQYLEVLQTLLSRT